LEGEKLMVFGWFFPRKIKRNYEIVLELSILIRIQTSLLEIKREARDSLETRKLVGF
jgi:hypothetical protein